MSLYINTLSFAVLAMLTPGPAMLAMTSYAISQPWRQTLMLLCGIRTGDAILLGFVLLGMSALIHEHVAWFKILEKAGALYLLWIGCVALLKKTDLAEKKLRFKSATAFVAGFSTGIANPKALLLYITVLPAMLGVESLSFTNAVQVWAILIPFYVIISLALFGSASRVRALLQNDAWRALFQKAMGTIMIAIALFALFSG